MATACTWFLAFSISRLVTSPNGRPRLMTSASVMSLGSLRMWMTRDGRLGPLMSPLNFLLSFPLAAGAKRQSVQPLSGEVVYLTPCMLLLRFGHFAHVHNAAGQQERENIAEKPLKKNSKPLALFSLALCRLRYRLVVIATDNKANLCFKFQHPKITETFQTKIKTFSRVQFQVFRLDVCFKINK